MQWRPARGRAPSRRPPTDPPIGKNGIDMCTPQASCWECCWESGTATIWQSRVYCSGWACVRQATRGSWSPPAAALPRCASTITTVLTSFLLAVNSSWLRCVCVCVRRYVHGELPRALVLPVSRAPRPAHTERRRATHHHLYPSVRFVGSVRARPSDVLCPSRWAHLT